jgi:hypothetical protein
MVPFYSQLSLLNLYKLVLERKLSNQSILFIHNILIYKGIFKYFRPSNWQYKILYNHILNKKLFGSSCYLIFRCVISSKVQEICLESNSIDLSCRRNDAIAQGAFRHKLGETIITKSDHYFIHGSSINRSLEKP